MICNNLTYYHRQAVNIMNYKDTCGSDGTLYTNCVNAKESTAEWNYGANFGGPTKSTWTSGADSLTMGVASDYSGVGMFGKFAVGSNNYDNDDGGNATNKALKIRMCDGVNANVTGPRKIGEGKGDEWKATGSVWCKG